MDIYGTEARWRRDGTQAMRATGLMRGAEILWLEAESKKETCDFNLRLRFVVGAMGNEANEDCAFTVGAARCGVVLEQRG